MELSTSVRNLTETTSKDRTELPFRELFFHCMDFICAIYLPLLTFGITANILNIVVYAKTKVRDNITVSFLALSMSDLLYLALLSPHLITKMLIHFMELRFGKSMKWLVDPRILMFPFYWYAFAFYEASILINVYISVVRCACVALPFKVKSTFTAGRAIVAFVSFFVAVFFLRVPMFMKKQIVREFDPLSNATRVVYREAEDGGLAEKLNDIVSRNILNWASFVIVITCLVVMVTKLKASVRFRSSNALPKSPSHPTNISEPTDNSTSDINLHGSVDTLSNTQDHQAHATQKERNNGKTQPLKENSYPGRTQTKPFEDKSLVSDRVNHKVVLTKETQVVRSVILVATIFIICQTPLMAYTLARRFESQFDDQDDMSSEGVQKYVFLFGICSNISQVFSLINASVNIIVYYNFNSRYRQCLQRLWVCPSSKNSMASRYLNT